MQRTASALIILPFIVALALPLSTNAADCSSIPGTRAATAADAAVKNGQIPVGTCYNPGDESIGKNDEEAKQFLITRYTSPGGCSQKGLANPKVDGIEKLDSQFAVNLAAMLKAAPMVININSAFRTQEAQQCANPKVTNSNHSKGCAVDLGYSQNDCSSAACQWIKANASKYSIQLRMQYAPEWNHIEPLSCKGTSTGSVQTSGNNAPFDQALRGLLGQGQLNASQCMTSVSPLVIAPAGTVQQSQCLTNASGQQLSAPPPSSVGGSIALPPAPVSSIPGGTTATPPQLGTVNSTPFVAGTCSPQTYCSQTDGNIYYRATTCVDQLYQKCGNGCSGVVCSATSSPSNTQLPGLSSNTNTNTNTNSNSTSTFDLIDFFAQGSAATAANVGTATPIAINQSIEDVGNASTLGPIAPDGTIQTGLQASSTAYNTSGGQQTFTSGDLANSPSGYTFTQTTFAQQVLAQMKATLVAMLPYLQPFGGVVLTQSAIE